MADLITKKEYLLTFYCTNPYEATFEGKKIRDGFNYFIVNEYTDLSPQKIENAPEGMTISEYSVYDLSKLNIPR